VLSTRTIENLNVQYIICEKIIPFWS